MPAPLDQLLAGIDVVSTVGEPGGLEVSGVTHDSNAVGPGWLFCCVPGRRQDGHDFAAAAVRAGAVALLCEHPVEAGAVQVVVPSVRRAMGPVAAAFHRHPSRAVEVVGVTGTNGKTTTVHLLASILEAGGRSAAVIGTLTGSRTTPEAPELQARLAACRDRDKQAVAMEVSSHALALHRVDGTWFEVAVFTNLSRDHLDFHPTMEDYFQAKTALFAPERAARAVIGVDDPHGRRLLESARIPATGYGMADAVGLVVGAGSSRFTWRDQPMTVPIGGRFNVSNALAAATAAAELGIERAAIAEGLAGAGPVPGRFEGVDAGQPFSVVVDYAHTPHGLEELLLTAREVAGGGRVLVVFGCGGDRDPTKRPMMGEVAARLADRVVVTSDNPRGEDPDAIIAAILGGIPDALARERHGLLTVVPGRREAIATALGEAGDGDIVVIAGKGHETTQTTGDQVVEFDDRAVARQLLSGHAPPSGRGRRW